MLLPPIFLYINKISIPLIESKKPPVKEIRGMKELNPNKNSIKGTKQAKTHAGNLLTRISYMNVFFKRSPCAIKAVKVVVNPIKIATANTLCSKKYFNPGNAESAVCGPEIPNIKRIKRIY